MQMSNHVRAIQADLAAAASLGDESTAEAGRRLSEALESSLHLRLLDLLTDAAADLSAAVPGGHVEVRVAAREPGFVFVREDEAEDGPALPPAGEEASARISLRLPESLKAAVESAAAAAGVSANAWIVRALSRALEPGPVPVVKGSRRLQGFARS
jgi:hypothetical protein